MVRLAASEIDLTNVEDVTEPYRTHPIDEVSRARLAAGGLRMDLVDTADRATFSAWLQAESRGFHQGTLSDDELGWLLEGVADRRTTGVWDDAVEPVGTANSWPGRMTVPGGADLPSWAISFVSVAPTHRRRGIARALLEAELRTAAALGLPMAMLTVSESTLYGRYGFAPAAFASDLTIDTRRAVWSGPIPAGRVGYVDIRGWRERIGPLHERARRRSPGDVEVFPFRWDQLGGLKTEDKGAARRTRAVGYRDEQGELRGLVLYRVGGGDDDFTQHHVSVSLLVAETDDAYAALWRFVLEQDLVTEVRAHLRPPDEPLRWMVRDQRGIRQTITDHHWIRILDVKTALEARRYERDGVLEFRVTDPLGFAEGAYRLEVAGGVGTVTSDAGDGGLDVDIARLSAAYLGAVPPVAPELQLLGTARAPSLSTWY